MKTIKASYEILNKEKINGEELLRDIEVIGRTCYKSEKMINNDSAEKFVSTLIKNGHEAMIEHNSITVKFICDRGVSHELVRHRLASFAQESTRYCNYSKDKFDNEITVILPSFFDDDTKKMVMWLDSMYAAEKHYFRLLELGSTPQEARSVLPTSLKTEVVMTMNLREWRHFFKLRCAKAAHPQMRELTLPLLGEMINLIPVVFDDLINLLTGTSFEQFVIDAVNKDLTIRIDGSAPTPDELVRSLQVDNVMAPSHQDNLIGALGAFALMSDDSRYRSTTRLPHIPSFLRDREVK